MYRRSKSQSINPYYILVFTLGVIAGIILAVLFVCPMTQCPQGQDGCQDTCLLIHVVDQNGDPVVDATVTLYDSDGDPIVSGTTNSAGDFIHEANLYGCGTAPTKIAIEGEHLGGLPWYHEVLIGTSQAVCQRDPLTGCCQVTVNVNTG